VTLSGERPTAGGHFVNALILKQKSLVTKRSGYSHPPYSANFSYYEMLRPVRFARWSLTLLRSSVRQTMEMACEIGLLSEKRRTLVLFQW
jgi:hypothetical protein